MLADFNKVPKNFNRGLLLGASFRTDCESQLKLFD